MRYGQLEQSLFGSKENYLKAVARNRKRQKLIEECYSSLGYALVKALNNKQIKITGESKVLEDLNDLLTDLKDCKEGKF